MRDDGNLTRLRKLAIEVEKAITAYDQRDNLTTLAHLDTINRESREITANIFWANRNSGEVR